MNGVKSSIIPTSILQGKPLHTLTKKEDEYKSFLVSQLQILKYELYNSNNNSFNIISEMLFLENGLWELNSYIYPYVRTTEEGSIIYLWRINNVSLSLTRIDSSEYEARIYNVEDLIEGIENVNISATEMLNVIEDFFIESNRLLEERGINWRTHFGL